jgi:tetratricopeptide (TPR) repeat protein
MSEPVYSWNAAKNPRSPEVLAEVPGKEAFAGVRASLAEFEGPERVEELSAAYEALGELARANDVAAPGPQTAGDESRLTGRQIRLLLRLGRRDDAKDAIVQCLARAERRERRADIADLLVMTAVLDLAARDSEAALSRLSTAFSMARGISSTSGKAHALSSVGLAYAIAGQQDAATAALHRAALVYQRRADVSALGRVYNNIGAVYHIQGRFVEAIPYLELGLEFLSASPDLLLLLNSLNNNVRAFEQHYMERAADFRSTFDSLIPLVPSDTPRLGDLTVIPVGTMTTSQVATFSSDPYLAEVVLFAAVPEVKDDVCAD